MKKILLLICTLFFISGCTPYQEVNKMAIVDMIGISIEDDTYHLHLTITTKEKEKNSNENKHTVYEVTGKSLGEAFEKANYLDHKHTYFKHLAVILVDQNIINNKQSDTLLSFLKNKFTQINYLFLCSSNVKDIVTSFPTHQKIEQFIKEEQNQNGTMTLVTFEDVYAKYLDSKQDAYVPSIDIKEKNLVFSEMRILGTKEKLSLKETRTLFLLTNQIHHFNTSTIYQDNYYALVLDKLKTKLTYKNKKIIIKITGSIQSDDINKKEKKEIQEKMQSELKKEIEQFFDKRKEKHQLLTQVVNLIYLKERDKNKTLEIFQNADIHISIDLGGELI